MMILDSGLLFALPCMLNVFREMHSLGLAYVTQSNCACCRRRRNV